MDKFVFKYDLENSEIIWKILTLEVFSSQNTKIDMVDLKSHNLLKQRVVIPSSTRASFWFFFYVNVSISFSRWSAYPLTI